jgi:hypothetical protein
MYYTNCSYNGSNFTRESLWYYAQVEPNNSTVRYHSNPKKEQNAHCPSHPVTNSAESRPSATKLLRARGYLAPPSVNSCAAHTPSAPSPSEA